jgi:signal peptidase II
VKKRPLVSLILITVVALDQITKYLADTFISPARPVEVLPWFHLVNVRNTGAAFGMMSSLGNWFFIPVTLLAIAAVSYLLIKTDDSNVGFSLVLAGAVGNLIDRLLYGSVRDFLDFSLGSYHWPAFNVADASLSVGLFLLIVSTLFQKKPERRSTEQ